MTAAADILRELHAKGVQLYLRGGRLRATAAASKLTPDVLARLQANAEEIAALLRSGPRAANDQTVAGGRNAAALEVVRDLAAIGIALMLRGGRTLYVAHVLRDFDQLTDPLIARLHEHRSEIEKALAAITREVEHVPALHEWELYLTKSEIRPDTGIARVAPGKRTVKLTAPAFASVPSPASPCRPPQVSSIDRRQRYKTQLLRDAARVCCACGERRGPSGPLPYSWDSHVVGREMVLTCCAACRTKKRDEAGGQGFVERKPVINATPTDGGKDAS